MYVYFYDALNVLSLIPAFKNKKIVKIMLFAVYHTSNIEAMVLIRGHRFESYRERHIKMISLTCPAVCR